MSSIRGVPRRVGLPGGRVVSIRPVEPGDAAGLAALYDSLGADDRYCRFFVGHRPPDSFLVRMTHVRDRGGVGLVALVEERGWPGRIIAEASYELLDNGDGELGITVDPQQRGWLGPYLLEVLVEEARCRGVLNLEAEVLAINHRMLVVLRRRGIVALRHSSDPSTLRLATGVAQATPVWPEPPGRRRVLVEAPGLGWVAARTLQREGCDVIACPGPRRGGPPCPPERQETCPLAAGADLIVVAAELPDDVRASLLEGHRRLHLSVPVVVRSATDTSPLPEVRAHRQA